MAKRVYNQREGATAADDRLPARMLETPLEMGSGRVAALTASRLQTMVDSYYAARRLDESGRADPQDVKDLLLGPG